MKEPFLIVAGIIGLIGVAEHWTVFLEVLMAPTAILAVKALTLVVLTVMSGYAIREGVQQ